MREFKLFNVFHVLYIVIYAFMHILKYRMWILQNINHLFFLLSNCGETGVQLNEEIKHPLTLQLTIYSVIDASSKLIFFFFLLTHF